MGQATSGRCPPCGRVAVRDYAVLDMGRDAAQETAVREALRVPLSGAVKPYCRDRIGARASTATATA